jgi:hypothetical protein
LRGIFRGKSGDLLNFSNLKVIKIWESDFGNIKAIAENSSK